MRGDSPGLDWYQPRDPDDDHEDLVDLPAEELVIHSGVCSWYSLLTHDDD